MDFGAHLFHERDRSPWNLKMVRKAPSSLAPLLWLVLPLHNKWGGLYRGTATGTSHLTRFCVRAIFLRRHSYLVASVTTICIHFQTRVPDVEEATEGVL